MSFQYNFKRENAQIFNGDAKAQILYIHTAFQIRKTSRSSHMLHIRGKAYPSSKISVTGAVSGWGGGWGVGVGGQLSRTRISWIRQRISHDGFSCGGSCTVESM